PTTPLQVGQADSLCPDSVRCRGCGCFLDRGEFVTADIDGKRVERCFGIRGHAAASMRCEHALDDVGTCLSQAQYVQGEGALVVADSVHSLGEEGLDPGNVGGFGEIGHWGVRSGGLTAGSEVGGAQWAEQAAIWFDDGWSGSLGEAGVGAEGVCGGRTPAVAALRTSQGRAGGRTYP